MYSMGLWKTHFVIGTKASGLSLTKPIRSCQHELPTTLHTLESIPVGSLHRSPALLRFRLNEGFDGRYDLPVWIANGRSPADIRCAPYDFSAVDAFDDNAVDAAAGVL